MREQQIEEQFRKETEERQERARHLINETYQKAGEIYKKDFILIFEKALKMFAEYQKEDKEKKLKYIYVNCLRTRMETSTYEYLIRIMDEYGYADKKIVDLYYVPQYLQELINDDKEYFTKLIMSKVIRAKKYEVKDFLRRYIWDTYIKPIPQEIAEVISMTDMLEGYKNIEKSYEVEVAYGEMLEKYDVWWLFTTR